MRKEEEWGIILNFKNNGLNEKIVIFEKNKKI